MRVGRCILLIVPVVASAAAPARAQWVAAPDVGTNLGDVQPGKGSVGGSLGYYFRGRLGLELGFEYYSHFFKDDDVANLVPDPGDGRMVDLDTDAMSFMGNLVVPIHVQRAPRWLPYGTAGLGVMYAWFDSSNDTYDADQLNLGFNVGAGVMCSLSKLVGLRVDARYFHVLVDEDQRDGGYFKDYDFLRVSVGVTFGFPR